MLTGSLVLTAALMGLAATPHCASMCAAACAYGGRPGTACAPGGFAPGGALSATVPLLAGRVLGYAAAGAVAASVTQSFAWLGEALSWARPFWNVSQTLLLAFGLLLLVQGAFPAVLVDRVEVLRRKLDPSGRAVTGSSPARRSSGWRRFLLATLWPAVPCGVLHAALLVAALSSSAGEGALVMVAFGLASSPGLLVGQGLWQRVASAWRPSARPAAGEGGAHPVTVVRRGGALARSADTLPVRLAGAALAASAAWWIFGHRLAPSIAAWCA